MTERIHIIEKDGGWAVKREGGTRKGYGAKGEGVEGGTRKGYASKREAVEAGRDTLRNSGGGEIIVHGRDGRIRDKDTVFASRPRD